MKVYLMSCFYFIIKLINFDFVTIKQNQKVAVRRFESKQ